MYVKKMFMEKEVFFLEYLVMSSIFITQCKYLIMNDKGLVPSETLQTLFVTMEIS